MNRALLTVGNRRLLHALMLAPGAAVWCIGMTAPDPPLGPFIIQMPVAALLFVPDPASRAALAFEHANGPTVPGIQHLPDESWLRPALAQANWMLGGGTCKFNAAEIVHGLTPLSEFKL